MSLAETLARREREAATYRDNFSGRKSAWGDRSEDNEATLARAAAHRARMEDRERRLAAAAKAVAAGASERAAERENGLYYGALRYEAKRSVRARNASEAR